MERLVDIPPKENTQTPINLHETNSDYLIDLIDLEPFPPKTQFNSPKPQFNSANTQFNLLFEKNLRRFLELEKEKSEFRSHKAAPISLLDDDLAPAEAPIGEKEKKEVKEASEDSGSSIGGIESKVSNELVTEYDIYDPANRFPSPPLLLLDNWQVSNSNGRTATTSGAPDKTGESSPADIQVYTSFKKPSTTSSPTFQGAVPKVVSSKPKTLCRLNIPETLLADLRKDLRFQGYCHAWINRPDFCARGNLCFYKHMYPPGVAEEFGIMAVNLTGDGKTITKQVEEEIAASRAGWGRTLNPGVEEFTPGCYSQACRAFLITGQCRHEDRCWYQHKDAHHPLTVNSPTGIQKRYQEAEAPFPLRANSPTGTQKRYQAAEAPFLLRANSPTGTQRRHQTAETLFPLRANSPTGAQRRYYQGAETPFPLQRVSTDRWNDFVARSVSQYNATQIATGLELSVHRPRNFNGLHVRTPIPRRPNDAHIATLIPRNSKDVGYIAKATPRSSNNAHIATLTPYSSKDVGYIAKATPHSSSNGHIATLIPYNSSDIGYIAKATPRSSSNANIAALTLRSSNGVVHISTPAARNFNDGQIATSAPRSSNDMAHIVMATPAQKTVPEGSSSLISKNNHLNLTATTPAAPQSNVREITEGESFGPTISFDTIPSAANFNNALGSNGPTTTYNALESNGPVTYNALESNGPATSMSDILVPTPIRAATSSKLYSSWDDAPPKTAKSIDFWVGKPAIVVERPVIVATEAQANAYVVAPSPVKNLKPEPQVDETDEPAVERTRVNPFDKAWEKKLIDF